MTADLFEKDLVISVEKLISWLGHAPLTYAYPHGSNAPGDEKICAKYFKHVVTTQRGYIDDATNPLCLPRFYWNDNLPNRTRHKRWLLTGGY